MYRQGEGYKEDQHVMSLLYTSYDLLLTSLILLLLLERAVKIKYIYTAFTHRNKTCVVMN